MGLDLQSLQKAVEKLQEEYDMYVVHHGIAKIPEKDAYLSKQLQDVLALFDRNQDGVVTAGERHLLSYLRGWALNIGDHYCSDSEQLLTRATKLQPDHMEAWNQLGSCVWKRGDSALAYHCFSHALQLKENAVSLRQLSIVQRGMQPTEDGGDVHSRRRQMVTASLENARRAVQLDVSDGVSWSILGNAYLSSYFVVRSDPKLVDQCLAAYQRAEMDPRARNNPELHFNRALCLRFAACYQQTLDSLQMALQLQPGWSLAEQHRSSLVTFINTVHSMVSERGKLKHRKLTAFTEELKRPRLGIYSDECVINKVKVSLNVCSFCELVTGVNADRVVVGKVVASTIVDNDTAFTFCMVDADCDCLAVNVYNMASGKGFLIGDMVAIPQPHFSTVDVRLDGNVVSFRLIRVQTPSALVVNGRQVSHSIQAPIQLTTSHCV